MSNIYIQEPPTFGKVFKRMTCLKICMMYTMIIYIVIQSMEVLFFCCLIKLHTYHAQVLLKTTVGDIDIELWSKEAPKACRNFVQLSLEGYYNGTIFHRVVKDFIVQGGDPTGTGEGGESIYGHPFKVFIPL
jgi:hypothetical protein